MNETENTYIQSHFGLNPMDHGILRVEGGDHIFNAPAREKLIAETVTWLEAKTR